MINFRFVSDMTTYKLLHAVLDGVRTFCVRQVDFAWDVVNSIFEGTSRAAGWLQDVDLEEVLGESVKEGIRKFGHFLRNANR